MRGAVRLAHRLQTQEEEDMRKMPRLVGGSTGLILLLWVGLSWGGPPNPTPSDAQGNTAGGTGALGVNTTGANNTASGSYTLYSNTTGDYNTASGNDALASNTTGNGNIAVGHRAGITLTQGDNNIYLGHEGLAIEYNTIRLGTSQLRTYIAGIAGRPVPSAHLRVLTAPPPAYPLCHLLLTAEAWARSLCQPRPHSAFLMPSTPWPATQKAAQTREAHLEAGLRPTALHLLPHCV